MFRLLGSTQDAGGGLERRQCRFDGGIELVGITVQAGYLVLRPAWTQPWWRLGAAYVVLMALLGTAVWEGSPGAFVRVLLPLTFAFNVLVTQSRWFWPLAILGNLSVYHGLEMFRVPWLWPSL